MPGTVRRALRDPAQPRGPVGSHKSVGRSSSALRERVVRYRGCVRQIVSTAAVIGAVLGVASCSAGTGQAGHVATVSWGRAGGSFPRGCRFGGWPSAASQEGGFADGGGARAGR